MAAVLKSVNMAGKFYFVPEWPSGFSNLKQLQAAARNNKIIKTAGDLIAWLEAQDAYTLRRQVRKIFRVIFTA